jgi:hypothetical protein
VTLDCWREGLGVRIRLPPAVRHANRKAGLEKCREARVRVLASDIVDDPFLTR